MDLEKDCQPQTQSRTVLKLYAQELIKAKNVSAALLDVSKAFDSINHKNFDEKLDMICFNSSYRQAVNQKFAVSSRAASINTKNSIQSILTHRSSSSRKDLRSTAVQFIRKRHA